MMGGAGQEHRCCLGVCRTYISDCPVNRAPHPSNSKEGSSGAGAGRETGVILRTGLSFCRAILADLRPLRVSVAALHATPLQNLLHAKNYRGRWGGGEARQARNEKLRTTQKKYGQANKLLISPFAMTAKQIKNLRRKRGLLQKELAALCGVSVRTVQGWEQGKAPNGSAKLLLNTLSK